MSQHMVRIVAAAALVLGAALFAIGISTERHEETPSEVAEIAQDGPSASEHSEGEAVGERSEVGRSEADEQEESDATLAGIDLESAPFVITAIAISVGLAAGLLVTRASALLGLAIAFALVFAVADLREVIVQENESTGTLVLVSAVLFLHVLAAASAALAWRNVVRIRSAAAS